MKIKFATTNTAKFDAAQRAFECYGLRIDRAEIDFVEPQLDDIVQIVHAKLAQAQLDSNDTLTVVEDTAIGLTAFGGFPGPYIKYVHSRIGNAGLLRLMKHESDRRVTIDSVCGAASSALNEVLITRTTRTHYHVRTVERHSDIAGWSHIWDILDSEPTALELTSIEKMAAFVAESPFLERSV